MATMAGYIFTKLQKNPVKSGSVVRLAIWLLFYTQKNKKSGKFDLNKTRKKTFFQGFLISPEKKECIFFGLPKIVCVRLIDWLTDLIWSLKMIWFINWLIFTKCYKISWSKKTRKSLWSYNKVRIKYDSSAIHQFRLIDWFKYTEPFRWLLVWSELWRLMNDDVKNSM